MLRVIYGCIKEWSVCVRAEREKGGRLVSVENPDICVHTNVLLSPWNPDSTFITSANRAAAALLYLIFTLVWLLITFQNRVRSQRPNKTTRFTAQKKAWPSSCVWVLEEEEHFSVLSSDTASDVRVEVWGGWFDGAASCLDNYEDTLVSNDETRSLPACVVFASE